MSARPDQALTIAMRLKVPSETIGYLIVQTDLLENGDVFENLLRNQGRFALFSENGTCLYAQEGCPAMLSFDELRRGKYEEPGLPDRRRRKIRRDPQADEGGRHPCRDALSGLSAAAGAGQQHFPGGGHRDADAAVDCRAFDRTVQLPFQAAESADEEDWRDDAGQSGGAVCAGGGERFERGHVPPE